MRHTNTNSSRRLDNIDHFDIITANEMAVIEGARAGPRFDNSRAVRVHYRDGSLADGFAWRSALSRRSDRSFMVQVARRAVQPTIDAYRAGRGDRCETCGRVSSGDALDVHHSIGVTLCELLAVWVEKETLFWGEPKTDRGGAQAKFVDPDSASRWREFHDGKCRLELLCIECHRDAHRSKASGFLENSDFGEFL